jgi:hypothetical protein
MSLKEANEQHENEGDPGAMAPEQLLSAAKETAATMLTLSSEDRVAELAAMKRWDSTFHALVMAQLEDIRSKAN